MYSAQFGMHTNPFLPLSDPETIFRSSQVRETLLHFVHARKNHHGMFLLAGEVGSGKTTAIHAALRGLPPKTPVAFPPPTTSTPSELLDELCLAVGLAKRARELKAERQRRLEDVLARLSAEGRKPVVIVDEAHLVPDAVFEQLRLLTNLRGGRHPVLQICLVGQPELVGRLRSDHLRQLRQRVTLRYTLMPLTYDETRLYLIERLRAAGARSPHDVFTPEAVRAVFAMTVGIPREINIVADQAMTNAFMQNVSIVHDRHVLTVGSDFGFEGLFLSQLQRTEPLPPEPQSMSPAVEETVPTTPPPSSVESLPDAPPVQTPVPVPVSVASTGAEIDAAPASMASPEESRRPVDTLEHRARAIVAGVHRLIRYRPAAGRLALTFATAGAAVALAASWLPFDRGEENLPPVPPAATETTSHMALMLPPPDNAQDAIEIGEALPEPPAVEGEGDIDVVSDSSIDEAVEPTRTVQPVREPIAETPSKNPGTLEERFPSTLEVESAVPAVVWLGEDRLGMAPGSFSPVRPGRYELRLDAGDGRVFSKNVIVTVGSTTYVRARAFHP